MDNQVQRLNMSKLASELLHNFFLDKVYQIGREASKGNGELTKQNQVRTIERNISNLITINKYSIFEIVLLELNCDDIENVDYGIVVKNFQYYKDDTMPNKYRIVIDQTWSSYSIYQRSLDDKYWVKLNKKSTIIKTL